MVLKSIPSEKIHFDETNTHDLVITTKNEYFHIEIGDIKMFKAVVWITLFFIPIMTMESLDANALGTIVPAYFYPSLLDPNNPWHDLLDAVNQIPVIAIINPNNGPGSSKNADYEQAIQKIHNVKENNANTQRGKAIGYVFTSYGTRAMTACKDDIDAYYRFYEVDGIFIDEMSTASDRVEFYRELYAYIRQKDSHAIVVGNPGTDTIQKYTDITHILNLFEQYEGFKEWAPNDWIKTKSPDHFSTFIYNVSDPNSMIKYINLAEDKNIGWIYITDDILPNPWDTHPGYWKEEVEYIKKINSLSRSNGEEGGCFIFDVVCLPNL